MRSDFSLKIMILWQWAGFVCVSTQSGVSKSRTKDPFARMVICTDMYGHTYSKSIDQPGKAANPARGQLNRENEYPLSPFAPENLVSRDGFGSPVPRQPAHLLTQAEPGAYLQDSSRVPRRRPFIHFNRHAPSGQSRLNRVTQLRTDGVHCRESAGTGPVNLKVVPNGCCLGRSPWIN